MKKVLPTYMYMYYCDFFVELRELFANASNVFVSY